jgi:hypothetical protein
MTTNSFSQILQIHVYGQFSWFHKCIHVPMFLEMGINLC